METLGQNGVLISFGAMSGKPLVISPANLLFKTATVKGFWGSKRAEQTSPAELGRMIGELVKLAATGAHFDLIVADPPFGEKNVGRRSTSMSQRLLDDEQLPSLLAPGGLFVLGHTSRDTVTLTPAWEEVKEMKHGDSMMRFLKRKL